MNKKLLARRNYRSLSLRDLLDARDTYHVHLAHLDNVVATAIGRKRFRASDLDKSGNLKQRPDGSKTVSKGEKRLDNTVAPPWAWPCVLVFVRDWLEGDDFRNRPDQIVPEYLYLPDGRVIPTCVLRLIESDSPGAASDHLNFASDMIGGGYVAVADVQGRTHASSIGCLVTDGDTTYALTNRHVTGAAGGRQIDSVINGVRVRLGVTHDEPIGKRPFDEVYPGWPGTRALVNVDAGLIRIDDINQWTTQVFGIGEIDEPLDLNLNTLSLDLLGCKVRAFGAASGAMTGQILALFYRYKSIGGFDYITDLLIGGPDGKSLPTLPGDSGTLWFFESLPEDLQELPPATDGSGNGHAHKNAKAAKSHTPERPAPRLHPIAMQWGGHVLMDSTDANRKEFNYALATCLSTVCRELDVDVVRDWNVGHVEYWGEMGHYTVGLKACALASEPKLAKLLKHNADRMGFEDAIMSDQQEYKKNLAHYSFVPLADVADNVWRSTRMGTGADHEENNDSNNHFADMDQPDASGVTLLDLCAAPTNIDPKVWLDFYDSLPTENGKKTNPGALPFRVWQMYDLAVDALKTGDVVGWFCLMGTMAHYVGDACQPLHVSRLHHGYPPLKSGTWKYKVHEVYETQMLDTHAAEVVAGLNQRLKNKHVADDGKRGGHEAAVLVVDLMRATINRIKPEDLVDTYNAGVKPADRLNDLWTNYGDLTITCMAEGAKTMAMLCERAWAEGGGPGVPDSKLKAIPKTTLSHLCRQTDFAPSMSLRLMVQNVFGGALTPHP